KAFWNQDEADFEVELSPSRLLLDVRLAASPIRLQAARQEAAGLLAAAPWAGLAGVPWGPLRLGAGRQERGALDLAYGCLDREDAAFVSEELHGLDPVKQLERCRELARQGYRPASLAVAARPTGGLVTASVWHRPVVPEAAKEALARRQAQAAVMLLQLGPAERVWP